MPEQVTQFPRPASLAKPPLALFLRPGQSDHKELTNVLLAGPQKFFGAVIDATMAERQKDLLSQLKSTRLDVVLDPRTQQSAFEFAHRPALAKLPWGLERPHVLDDFREFAGRQRAIQIAEFAVAKSFTQVLAPTHLLTSANDAWFSVDCDMTTWLRAELDKRGGTAIPIVYSLAIPGAVFRDNEQVSAIVASLARLPIHGLWLKVDGFGADATAHALTKAMDSLSAFHALGLPVVADCVGGVPGLALLAFGAVGGIAHGIATTESFKTNSWKKPHSSGGGGGWRIYCPTLGMTLTRKEAHALLNSTPRAKALFGNPNTAACPRGVDDMLHSPLRAFVVQRADEIAQIGATPESLRAQQFVEKTIRPMTDRALAATQIQWKEGDKLGLKLAARFSKHRKQIENIRIALGVRSERMTNHSTALSPPTRIAREGRG